jgi:hypothetical protein
MHKSAVFMCYMLNVTCIIFHMNAAVSIAQCVVGFVDLYDFRVAPTSFASGILVWGILGQDTPPSFTRVNILPPHSHQSPPLPTSSDCTSCLHDTPPPTPHQHRHWQWAWACCALCP